MTDEIYNIRSIREKSQECYKEALINFCIAIIISIVSLSWNWLWPMALPFYVMCIGLWIRESYWDTKEYMIKLNKEKKK